QGETVRYSALAPKPAAGRPGAPRPGGPRVGRPEAPAGPEIQRATRQAPRPGGQVVDRRPDDDEDAARRGGKAAPNKAVSRVKGAPQRREGRLTIQAVAGNDDE